MTLPRQTPPAAQKSIAWMIIAAALLAAIAFGIFVLVLAPDDVLREARQQIGFLSTDTPPPLPTATTAAVASAPLQPAPPVTDANCPTPTDAESWRVGMFLTVLNPSSPTARVNLRERPNGQWPRYETLPNRSRVVLLSEAPTCETNGVMVRHWWFVRAMNDGVEGYVEQTSILRVGAITPTPSG